MEDRGELHADDAGTDDGEVLGQGVQLEQTGAVDEARVIDVRKRQELGAAAGGNDDAFGGDSIARLRTDGVGIDKTGMAADEGDIGMRENGLNTGTELRDDCCHTLAGFGKGGTVDVGLCGNTADVQARAADVLTFEDGDLQALFGSIFSGAVATWPRTDDDEISCCH